MDTAYLEWKLSVIKSAGIKVQLTLVEARQLERVLSLDEDLIVEACLVKSSLWDKIGDAFKKALNVFLKGLLPFLILIPTANGMSIQDPKKLGDAFAKMAETQLEMKLDVSTQEIKMGNEIQSVIWHIKDKNGDKAKMSFIGEKDKKNVLEMEEVEGSPEFKALMDSWQNEMAKKIEEANKKKS